MVAAMIRSQTKNTLSMTLTFYSFQESLTAPYNTKAMRMKTAKAISRNMGAIYDSANLLLIFRG